MAELTEERIQKLARLARIRIEPEEIPKLQTDLQLIFKWIEQLNEVDVSNVAPITGAADMALKMREDVVNDGGIVEEVLGNAPDRVGDFYAVPKVIE